MTFQFRGNQHVRKKHEFREIWSKHNRKVGKYLCLDYAFGTNSFPKLGISVTKKFGKAPLRNRFKRIVREAFRLNQHCLPKNIALNIIARSQAKEAKTEHIAEELLSLIKITDNNF